MCWLCPDPLWFQSKTYTFSFPIHITTQKKASFRSPCTSAVSKARAVTPRKVDEMRFIAHLGCRCQSKAEEVQPGQRWKHGQGCRLRERRWWRGSALTPAARAAGDTLQAVPGSSGCDCIPSGVTHHFWNCSLACTLFAAHRFSLKNDVRAHRQDWVLLKKEEDCYNITRTQASTAAQAWSLVLGKSSLNKAVAPLGFSALTVLHRSSLTVLVWLQCRQLQASQGILAGRVEMVYAQTCPLKYLPSTVTKTCRWLNSRIMLWSKCLFVFCKAISVH